MIDQNQEETTQEQYISPRAQAMQQIASNVHAALAGDLQEFDEESGEIIKKSPSENQTQETKEYSENREEPTREQLLRAAEEKFAEEEGNSEQSNPLEEFETIIVDGQQIKVEREKLLEAGRKTLQKETAADRRLYEATLARQQWEAKLQQLNHGALSSDAHHNQSLPDQGANSRINQATNGMTPEMLENQRIDARLYLRDAEKAAERFKSEYSDIMADPKLQAWVVMLENQRLEHAVSVGEPLGDPWEAYKKHGETVRSYKGAQVQQPSNKTELKRSIVNVSSASARLESKPQQRPKTTSEIIEETRKSRGQRVA